MKTLRTSTKLTRHDARRLTSGGFEIAYIETRHLQDREDTTIVWTRPYAPGEIRDEELPY
jgi:hypothetical protein